MNRTRIFILIFALLAGNFSLKAQATKLVAPPLPHRTDKQAGDAQQVAPSISRFYPAEDAKSNPAANQGKPEEKKPTSQQLSAEELRQKAEEEKIKAEKLREQQSIAANNKGVQLGQAGKFDEAITAHEEAVQLAPGNKQFRINLSAAYCAYGQKLLEKKNFGTAAHLFRQSIVAAADNGLAGRMLIETLKKSGINPNSADDRLALGDQLISQGDLSGAGIEYQAAEQLEESARTFAKLGDYYYRLGQIDLAAVWYKQSMVKNADYRPAYRQLGFIAVAKQDQAQAAALLRKAVILDSKDTAAGQTLVDLWRRQVANNPQIAENHLGLAGALQITGDLDGAEAEYAKVVAMDPHHPALPAARVSLRHAYQHAQAQRHEEAANTLWQESLQREALAEISQAVRLEPRNAQYQLFLGQCLESIGDFQGAHQAYLTCVLIDPENNKDAAARLKDLQQKTNGSANVAQSGSPARRVEAIDPYTDSPSTNQVNNQAISQPVNQSINQAANQQTAFSPNAGQNNASPVAAAGETNANPNLPDKNNNSILSQVETLEKARNYDTAINVLRPIVSNNLENPEMHHRLAVDLMSAGEIGEAISEFRIASALSPTHKAYADDLAQALAINKQSMGSEEKGKSQ